MKQKLSLIQIYYIIRLKYSFDSRYQKVNGVFWVTIVYNDFGSQGSTSFRSKCWAGGW